MTISQFIADHRLLVFGIAAIIGTTISVVIAVALRNRPGRRGSPRIPNPPAPKKTPPPKPSTVPEPPTSVPQSPSPQPPAPKETPPPKPPTSQPWPKPPVAGDGISPDWVEFVHDRLSELNPASCTDETKWALGIVDFLDELAEANAEASAEERAEATKLRKSIAAILADRHFALLDSDEWNPETQRAVAVVRKPDVTETAILGKGSTGLSRNGKVIRKQEVKISTKGN